MSDNRIEGYARALFEIARAEGTIDEVEDELFRLTEWCAERDMHLTFIEVMPMRDIGNADRLGRYWPVSDLRP